VVEAAHEADLYQPSAEFGFALDDVQRRCGVGGQRLLTQHRFAVLQAGQQLLLVGGPGRRQHHGVDVRVRDRIQRVGDGTAPGDPGSDLIGLLGHVVVDHGDLGSGDPRLDAGDVVGTHHADPQDGNTQV
jgi:hypothetical protein